MQYLFYISQLNQGADVQPGEGFGEFGRTLLFLANETSVYREKNIPIFAL